ncbi:hypothetical protein TIFTF001_024625 [Ficus carica]|uniref:Uncharacterized protein n=1 Tax=Ficus carica TaxID=3494 RepID=A0AA88DGY9_FICCA|nr:hypothetical protein TIFTF001_024625 [Ficus carica]
MQDLDSYQMWKAQVFSNYFSSPWTVVALLAAGLAMAMSGIQIWYTVYPPPQPLVINNSRLICHDILALIFATNSKTKNAIIPQHRQEPTGDCCPPLPTLSCPIAINSADYRNTG